MNVINVSTPATKTIVNVSSPGTTAIKVYVKGISQGAGINRPTITIEYKIGTTEGAPVEGENTFVVPGGEGYQLELKRGKIDQSELEGDYTWNSETALLTVPDTWSKELVKLKLFV